MPDWPFFSSDPFLQVLADVYFPGAQPEVVACEGQRFRVLSHRGRSVSGFWDYPFRLEPLRDKPRARVVPFVADVLQAELPIEASPAPGLVASPLVRWSAFSSFEQFESWAGERHRSVSAKAHRQRVSRMERDLGPVCFLPEDSSRELFDAVLRWKSAQYMRGGYPDRFTGARRRLYEVMRDRDLLTASSLRAGGRIIAGHLSNRADGSLLYRLPAYDYAFRKYSPGAIHLRYLLRDSFERGDNEFDFLAGAEPYKLQYATHVRYLGPLGAEPRLHAFQRRSRSAAATALRKHPWALGGARLLESRLRRLLP